VVKQAVQKLFESGHFSICQLDKVLEVVGARQSGEAYRMLNALHCVDFGKMDPDLRARIPQLVNECLRQRDNVSDATQVALQGVVM
jgi:hypothetical protein